MDRKWAFAIRHGWGSLLGIFRLFLSKPLFAAKLLHRRLTYFVTRRLDKPLMTPTSFFIDTPDTLIAYWSMFVERELHDSSWVRCIAAVANPLVVDVGANAGVFSHYVHCLKHDCEFVAFEPLPPMVQRIGSLKERTGINITVHQKAVARNCGEAMFESAHGYDGTSRLAAPGRVSANTFRVETTTLDTVLKDRNVTLMKIDVEGFECEVIEGGRQCLSRTDFVIMEAENPEHLANITRALGEGWIRRKVGATDYLFIREPRS
jgi:FkbM family methyltransferase